MSRVLLQPASSAEAKGHYRDTIVAPVPLARIATHLSANEEHDLAQVFPGGSAMVWGLTPGRGPTIWPVLTHGDIVLFYASGFIVSSATIRAKIRNSGLASNLWGTNATGVSWEYVYFVDDLIPRHFSVTKLAALLGRAPNWIVQGAELLSAEKSLLLDEALGLVGDDAPQTIDLADYNAVVTGPQLGTPLDKQGYHNQRVEQGYLRGLLFGKNAIGRCSICGGSFPTSMLICAHLKKRSQCSDAEKLDAVNIVLPMCAFGCDALYESRMISIKHGMVAALNTSRATPDVQLRIDAVNGKAVVGYKPTMQKYIDFTAG